MGVYAQFPYYPSMERQDLSQGQLGSFKFAPVDVIRQPRVHNQFLNDLAREHMSSHLKVAAQHSATVPPRSLRSRALGSSEVDASNQQNPFTHHIPTSPTSDSGFFNHHIKPDLTDSRLKYGPAAVRSAVDSNSPEKKRDRERVRAEAQLFATSSNGFHQANMNPIASNFVPSVQTQYNNDALVRSLNRALAMEQQSHEATESSLRDAYTRVVELEAQLNKVERDNKTLVSTVSMLKGIVKHQKDKLQAIESPPTKSSDDDMTVRNHRAQEVVDLSRSILYDALAEQRAKYEQGTSCTPSESISSEDPALLKSTDPQLSNSQVFNLELLKNHGVEDGRFASLSRKLRRHFALDPTGEPWPEQAAPVSPVKNSENHISLEPSPKHVQAGNKLDKIMHSDGEQAPKSSEQAPIMSGEQALDIVHGMVNLKKKTTHELATLPALEIPQSFLSKYCAPSTSIVSKPALKETDSAPENPFKAHAEASDDGCHVSAVSPFNRIVKMPQQFDLSIRWKITKENPIFDEDEDTAYMRFGDYRGADTTFWDHPVRYLDYTERNLFRTVMIDYIPINATYKDVLQPIHGGSIEQITLVGPISKNANYKTARVVFNYELGASTTANYARDHGMKIHGSSVRVWQVTNQTYPKNKQLDKDVFENAFTRILLFAGMTDEQFELIAPKLALLTANIVEIGRAPDGLPMVEFTDVTTASKVLGQIVHDPDFDGVQFDFEEDPCAEPYPGDAATPPACTTY